MNDAVESNVSSVSFYGVLAETFSFFNRSINGSADFKKLGCVDVKDKDKPLSLKKLCTTRWSSRIESIRGIKNRIPDILKLLKQYSKGCESKEKSEASDLLKKIGTLEILQLNTTSTGPVAYFRKSLAKDMFVKIRQPLSSSHQKHPQ